MEGNHPKKVLLTRKLCSLSPRGQKSCWVDTAALLVVPDRVNAAA